MHSSAFDTSLYPSLSKRQKDKKAHDSFEDGNKEKETDQQGKNRKQRPCFPKIVYKYLPDFLLL